jgi:hypothetical protein
MRVDLRCRAAYCNEIGGKVPRLHDQSGLLQSEVLAMVTERLCTVCGYEMEDGPRDYNICPSCGTEFGIHDVNSSIENLRDLWLKSGPRWHSTIVDQPAKWDPFEQFIKLYLTPSVPIFRAGSAYPGAVKFAMARYRRKRVRTRSVRNRPTIYNGLAPQRVA